MTEYIVTLKGRRRAQKKRLKTLALPSKRNDYLGRRRKGHVYVKYYDLGQLAVGGDIDFSKQCTIDVVRDASPIDDQTVPEIVLNYNDFSSELLAYYSAIDRTTWSSTFQEIDDVLYPEYESTFIVTGQGYVPGRGFELNQADQDGGIGVSSLRHFYNVFTEGDINNKVTATSNYADTEVTFTPDRSCEVYIIPQIHLWQGGNLYRVSPDINTRYGQILGLFLAPESREFTLNNVTWDGYKADFNAYLVSIGGGNRWLLSDSYSTTYHSAWVNLVMGHPSAQLYNFQYTNTDYPVAFHTSDLTAAAPSTFKDGTLQGVGGVDFTVNDPSFPQWQWGPWVGLRKWHQPEGLLIAVIKQGADWYYIWRATTVDAALYHSGSLIFNHPNAPSAGTSYGGVSWQFV